jgi:hypothetical protein
MKKNVRLENISPFLRVLVLLEIMFYSTEALFMTWIAVSL